MKCWAKDLIENDEIGIDAVISAAAISDHVVDEPFSGKISSDDVLTFDYLLPEDNRWYCDLVREESRC